MSQPVGSAASPNDAKRRLDPVEVVLGGALMALAFAVLGGLLLRTILKGGYVTGGDGFLVVDPLQYLNWIRQTEGHLAAANLYDFAPLRYTFVHPGLLAGAVVYKLSGGLVFSYAFFKPIAVLTLVLGVAGMAHRHLDLRADRRFALFIALFFCAPTAALGGWLLSASSPRKIDLDFAGGELWTGSYLWGYVFTAIAVGLVPLGLLAYERGRAGSSVRWAAGAAACALFASWLQPWQGATLVAVLVGTEVLSGRVSDKRWGVRAPGLLAAVSAGVLPLVYYLVLSKTDPAWQLAGEANALDRWPFWVLVITLLPIGIAALPAFGRGSWANPGAISLRLWPIVGLLIYFLPIGTFPFHALQGIQYPLAILSMITLRKKLGTRSLPLAAVGAAALVLVVPGTVYRVVQMKNAVSLGVQPFFLTDDEHAALAYLQRAEAPGGVLTENYLATVIPAYTGRATYFGAGSWTPDFKERRRLADALFAGHLTPVQARSLAVRPGAGYILDTCRGNRRFVDSIAGFSTLVWHKGCVRIFRIRGAQRVEGGR